MKYRSTKTYKGRAVDGIQEWENLPERLATIGTDTLGWAYFLASKYNIPEEDIVELSNDLGTLVIRAWKEVGVQ